MNYPLEMTILSMPRNLHAFQSPQRFPRLVAADSAWLDAYTGAYSGEKGDPSDDLVDTS